MQGRVRFSAKVSRFVWVFSFVSSSLSQVFTSGAIANVVASDISNEQVAIQSESANGHSSFRVLQAFNRNRFNGLVGQSAEAEDGVLVVSGGWGTCGKSPIGAAIYLRMAETLRALQSQNKNFRIVATCFGKVSPFAYFISSSDMETTIYGGIDDVADIIYMESKKTRTNDIYLVGHSHGGWLAMTMAKRLDRSINIKGLATIDPISRVYCTPATLFNSYFRSQFSIDPYPGCTKAPADFGSESRTAIRSRVGWWKNFYQMASVYLHSSVIGAAENFYIEYDVASVFDIFKPHIDIDSDARAWDEFEPLIVDLM